MAKELTVTGTILLEGVERDFAALNDKELSAVEEVWRRRLTDSMSRYYSAHEKELISV